MNILKTIFPFIFGKPEVKQLSMEEILDETINFYSSDTKLRSFQGSACYYNGPDGTHCAVGRCLLPELQSLGDKFNGNNSNLSGLLSKNKVKSLDELLQPQYRGHDKTFWTYLQLVHDSSSNWDDTGLTPNGEMMVERLRNNIKSGTYNG